MLIATGLGGMARWVATHHPDAIRAQEGVLTRSHRRLPHSPDVLASQCELRVLSTDPHTDAIPCLDRTQPREPHSGVGLDVLHDDDDLPARTLRHRIPDGQTVRRKMKTVRTWQRGYGGKRVGKCRDWFFEQVKNRPLSGVSKRLRQSFELVPSPVREAKNPVTH